jgi:hypothetical protein
MNSKDNIGIRSVPKRAQEISKGWERINVFILKGSTEKLAGLEQTNGVCELPGEGRCSS